MKLPDYFLKLKEEMVNLLGCPIEVIEDEGVDFPCKMEYAHNYARECHVIRVNPKECPNAYQPFSMLLMTRLQLRELPDGKGYGVLQPVSSPEECAKFDEAVKTDKAGQNLMRQFGPARFDGFVNMLRNGLVVQATSQVLEMLMIDVVQRDYPEAVEDMKVSLRPNALLGAKMTREQLREVYPRFLADTNRLLSLMFAMRCGEVCGEKFVDAYKPTSAEIDKALDLYNFYRTERDSIKESGKIIGDVLENMLKYTKVGRFAHLHVIEIAPIRLEKEGDDGFTDEQRAKLEEFKKRFGDENGTDSMMMSLTMLKVIRELKHWPLEEVKALGIEIAFLGATGIAPGKKYTLKCFPNRGEIIGHEVLAYYYVSWAMVFPDKLDMLGLPYKKSYAAAQSMVAALEKKSEI